MKSHNLVHPRQPDFVQRRPVAFLAHRDIDPQATQKTALPLFMTLWPALFVLLIARLVPGIIYPRTTRQSLLLSALGILTGGATVAVMLVIMKGAFRLP